MDCTPPNVIEEAQNISLHLLPDKSKKSYRNEENIKSSFSENVLMAYFGKLSKKSETKFAVGSIFYAS